MLGEDLPVASEATYRDDVMVGRSKKPAPVFGQRLSGLRREKGMTQAELATALGITGKLVDYYERRAPNPSLRFVKKVAAFFDVTPGYFLADSTTTKVRPGPKSRLDVRVAEIKKLPPKKQELAIKMLDLVINGA
jgi:transcriptional regulator with XRE-family HTH domain